MSGYPNDQGNPAGAIPVYLTGGSGGTIVPPAGMSVLGYSQITDLTAARTLIQGGGSAIPAGAKLAYVQAEGGNARWRADGVAPTATVGAILWGTAQMVIASSVFAGAKAIQFINMTGSTAILDITYYG